MLVYFSADWDVHWGYRLFDPWPYGCGSANCTTMTPGIVGTKAKTCVSSCFVLSHPCGFSSSAVFCFPRVSAADDSINQLDGSFKGSSMRVAKPKTEPGCFAAICGGTTPKEREAPVGNGKYGPLARLQTPRDIEPGPLENSLVFLKEITAFSGLDWLCKLGRCNHSCTHLPGAAYTQI